MPNSTALLYTWDFEDTKDRWPIWYTIALSISIGLIIWGFLTQQYGMSIVIMIIMGLFFFLENNSEDNVHVEVTDLGILIQWVFYDYSRIASYSIIYSWSDALFLRLHLKRKGVSSLNLHISNGIASDIQSFLWEFLEENERQEVSMTEKLIQFLKL